MHPHLYYQRCKETDVQNEDYFIFVAKRPRDHDLWSYRSEMGYDISAMAARKVAVGPV